MTAPDLDTPAPDIDPDPITPAGDVSCSVCGAPISWSGRGFRPKYCDEHRPARGGGKRATGDTAGKAPGGTGRGRTTTAAVNRAVETLEMIYGMGGGAVRLTVSPRVGAALVDKRVELAESYRMMLENSARFRSFFAEVEAKAAWLPILVVHADLASDLLISERLSRLEDEYAAGQYAGPPTAGPYAGG